MRAGVGASCCHGVSALCMAFVKDQELTSISALGRIECSRKSTVIVIASGPGHGVNVGHTRFIHFIDTSPLWGRDWHSHVTEKDTETWWGEATCPTTSHGNTREHWDLNPSQFDVG